MPAGLARRGWCVVGGRRSVRRSTALLAFLIVVLLVAAAVAGCGGAGAGTGAAGGGTGGSSEDAAASGGPTSSEPTVAPPRSEADPPDSTLGHGDRTVAGVLGSYCWSSGSAATCVDGAYNPASGGWAALAVPAGSEMEFDYGGEAAPDEVRAEAEPLGPDGESTGSSSRPLATGDPAAGGRVTIPAELPAGDYVGNLAVMCGTHGPTSGDGAGNL